MDVNSNAMRVTDGDGSERGLTLEEKVEYLERRLSALAFLLDFHCGLSGGRTPQGHPDLYERTVKAVTEFDAP